MRKIGANRIYCSPQHIYEQSYVVLNNENLIVDVVNTKGNMPETAGLEYYNGIIVPGFILTGNVESEVLRLSQEFVNVNLKYRVLWQRGIQCIAIDEETKTLATKYNNNFLIKEQNKNKVHAFEIIKQFTWSNAIHLGVDNKLGSLVTGKNPGLVLIKGLNFKTGEFSNSTSIQRLT